MDSNNHNLRIKTWSKNKIRKSDSVLGKPIKTKELAKEKVIVVDKPNVRVVFQNGEQEVVMMMLDKENLAYDGFQRPEKRAKINNIRENFNPSWGVVNVAESEIDDDTYFTVVDGQHRTEANPEDSVVSIVSNGVPPVEQFILGNSNSDNLSKDDILWARYEGYDPEVRWMVSRIRQCGIEPERTSGDLGRKNKKSGKFSGLANFWTGYDTRIKSKVRKQDKSLSEAEIINKSQSIFGDLLDIIFDTWGTDVFHPHRNDRDGQYDPNILKDSTSAYRDIVFGLIDFLSEVKFDYDVEVIVESLRKGWFKRGGRGPSIRPETYEHIEKIKRDAKTIYPNIWSTGGELRRQSTYSKMIFDIVKTYKSEIKKMTE